jgi:hypothetical protein
MWKDLVLILVSLERSRRYNVDGALNHVVSMYEAQLRRHWATLIAIVGEED